MSSMLSAPATIPATSEATFKPEAKAPAPMIKAEISEPN
jgi:hypothetical protein